MGRHRQVHNPKGQRVVMTILGVLIAVEVLILCTFFIH